MSIILRLRQSSRSDGKRTRRVRTFDLITVQGEWLITVAVPPRFMICRKCQKIESVYHRAYSGEYLCKKCFMRSIENKTAKTISRYSMIGYGDRVVVGVSGGKDSLSLLYVLKMLFDQHPNK